MKPVQIIIRGEHDTGRTTLASFIKMTLEENGYRNVRTTDTEPLPHDRKAPWFERFMRNRERPIHIIVETQS